MMADVDGALGTAARLVARFEGFRSRPYQDAAGVWTIGYGSTVLTDGSHVTENTPAMTQVQADALMRSKLADFLVYALYLVAVDLSSNEAAALTSFAYNLGKAALRGSTLLRLLNAGDRKGAADEFPKWCHADGRVLPGLVARRAAERAMFLGA